MCEKIRVPPPPPPLLLPPILEKKYVYCLRLVKVNLICGFRWGQFYTQGGTLIFSSYVGSGPVSTVQPPPPPRKKKYQEFQALQKNI